MANRSGARVARTVAEPQGNVPAAGLLANLDAFQDVIERGLANCRVGIAQRSILVNLILENIGVDGAETNPHLLRGSLHRRRALETLGEIPKDVRRHTGAAASKMVNLPRIGQLLFRGRGGGSLNKFAKTRTGVGESPGRKFDYKCI
jgi:hypothetical protein